MRLICGFFHRDGQTAEKGRLGAMVDAMIEPGLEPQIAQLTEGSLALAVLDFARKTPFEIAHGEHGLILAADCRLDEPEALRRMLGVDGAVADESLLLSALQDWGSAGISRIQGDFAFAAWNPQTRSLLCARDCMGIRPFFMAKNNQRDFAFASLPRALHAGGFATRCLDESYLVNELLNVFSCPERSLFQDISKLAPGNFLHVSSSEICPEVYWKLDPELAGSRTCSSEAAAEELSEKLIEAVRCRLPETGPVAAHLSGGLDSSAISVLAARMLRREKRPLLAYSFLPEIQGEEDERPFVEAVLKQETDIEWMPVTIADPEAFFMPRMDCDQLFPADSGHPDIRVCADAAGRGADMLLSGWGGDEGATFNGRGALAEALLNGRWRYLAQEIESLKRTRQWTVIQIMRGEVLAYLFSEQLRNWRRSLLGKHRHDIAARISRVLQPGFTDARRGEPLRIGPNAAMNRYMLLSSFHLARRAEQWALMGARHGLAVGFPMLDRRVVEFSLSLPSALFLRGGWKRRVFRDAMADVLPDAIRMRHGKLTPIPEVSGMMETQRERLLLYLAELRANPVIRTLFDLGEVEKILRSDWEGADIPALLRFLNMARYVQQHH